MRNWHVGDFISRRLVGGFKSTAFGCIIMAIAAIGQHLESTEGLKEYGKIISAVALIFSSIGHIVAKGEQKNG